MLLPFVLTLVSPPSVPVPDERYLDAVFARPTFASRRKVYDEAVKAGRIEWRESAPERRFVRISGPGGFNTSDPELLCVFDFRPEGGLATFTAYDVPYPGELYAIDRPAEPSELIRIREYVRDLTGETCTVELSEVSEDAHGSAYVWYRAFPLHNGRLVRREAAYVGTRGPATALTDYSRTNPPEAFRDLKFVEGPTLDRTILQGKAKAACADHLRRFPSDAAWYFVRSEGLEFDSLAATDEEKTFLPVYRRTECYANGNFEVVAIVDARDGRVRRVGDDRGRLGGGGRPVPPKTPRRITVDGVTSTMAPLSDPPVAKPAGEVREIASGAYVFVARHQAENRTLWLCTDPKIGYRPYKISEALNRTLARQPASGEVKR